MFLHWLKISKPKTRGRGPPLKIKIIARREAHVKQLLWKSPNKEPLVCDTEAFLWEWGFYWNVIPMWWDCGKPPILSSVYLTGCHRIFPSQWTSSQIAMGPQRFTGQVPLQEHETFPKNTWCMNIFQNMHAVFFLRVSVSVSFLGFEDPT